MRQPRRNASVIALLAAVGGLVAVCVLLGASLADGSAVAASVRLPVVRARESARAAVRPPSALPLLRLGARGPAVRALQRSLARLGYLPADAIDGVFGMRTWHAVVAVQGWNGLVRDGVAGPMTERALSRARRPRPWSTAPGIEVHIRAQVLLLVAGGRVQRAIHVSTGMPGHATPHGHFRIQARYRLSWSVPFRVWMPLAQYFHAGYALHEYPLVPAYPASHGCVRIPSSEAGVVWRFGRVGMRLWTIR